MKTPDLLLTGAPKLRSLRAKLTNRLQEARREAVTAGGAEAKIKANYAASLALDADGDPKRFRAEVEQAACAVSSAGAVIFALEDALARVTAELEPLEGEERDARLRTVLDKGETAAREASDDLAKLLPKLADILTRGFCADNNVTAAVQSLSGRLDPTRAPARFAPEDAAAEFVTTFARKLHAGADTFGGDGCAVRALYPDLGQTSISIPFNAAATRAACFIENDSK